MRCRVSAYIFSAGWGRWASNPRPCPVLIPCSTSRASWGQRVLRSILYHPVQFCSPVLSYRVGACPIPCLFPSVLFSSRCTLSFPILLQPSNRRGRSPSGGRGNQGKGTHKTGSSWNRLLAEKVLENRRQQRSSKQNNSDEANTIPFSFHFDACPHCRRRLNSNMSSKSTFKSTSSWLEGCQYNHKSHHKESTM